MRSQSVAARDASVPLRVTDRVRVLPLSDREVYLGTSAEGTILVPMKNRWGSVSTLLAHDRVAVNCDVREHQMEFMAVEAMGPPTILCASFRKVDVVYTPDEPHGASFANQAVSMLRWGANIWAQMYSGLTLYGGKLAYNTGGHSECTLRHSFEL